MVMRKSALVLALVLAGAAGHAAAQQVVRVGVASIGLPFSFHDDATNTDLGVMVDVANEIGKVAGVKMQMMSLAFGQLLTSLNQNKIDLIAATLTVTDQRKTLIAFSTPVYTDADTMVVPTSDAGTYVTADDAKGKTLGVQKGVVALPSLHTTLYPSIRVYDGGPDVMRAFATGEIQAGLADRSVVGYLLKAGGFANVRMVPSYKPTVFADIAFGVRKNDTALMTTVNTALAKLQADGTLKTIYAKWGLPSD